VCDGDGDSLRSDRRDFRVEISHGWGYKRTALHRWVWRHRHETLGVPVCVCLCVCVCGCVCVCEGDSVKLEKVKRNV